MGNDSICESTDEPQTMNCKYKAELAEYMGIAEGVTNVNILELWVNNEDLSPNLAVAYKKIILCQPSSAAVENVFSILKNSLTLIRILPWRD